MLLYVDIVSWEMQLSCVNSSSVALTPHHRNACLRHYSMRSGHDLDLLPSDLENFSTVPTHVINICAKLNWNTSTKFVSCKRSSLLTDKPRMDGRTDRQHTGKHTASATDVLAEQKWEQLEHVWMADSREAERTLWSLPELHDRCRNFSMVGLRVTFTVMW